MESTCAVPASHKVLSTFELIEQILLHLPLRKLLLAQGVNKAFFDVVSTSPDIRRALFLKPSAAVVHAFQGDQTDICSTTWRETQASESVKPIINPFIPLREIGYNDLDVEIKRALKNTDSTLLADPYPDSSVCRFVCRRKQTGDSVSTGSSWRKRVGDLISRRKRVENDDSCTISRDKMILTHPPVGRLILEQSYDGDATVLVGSATGTIYGELVEYGVSHGGLSRRGVKVSKKAPAVYDLEQAVSWKPLKQDIDSTTGVEMLEILSRKPGDDDEDSDWESDYSGESSDSSDDDSSDDDSSDDDSSQFGASSNCSGSGYGGLTYGGSSYGGSNYGGSGYGGSNYGGSEYGGSHYGSSYYGAESSYGGGSHYGGGGQSGRLGGGSLYRGRSRSGDPTRSRAPSQCKGSQVVRKSVFVKKSVVVRQTVVARKRAVMRRSSVTRSRSPATRIRS